MKKSNSVNRAALMVHYFYIIFFVLLVVLILLLLDDLFSHDESAWISVDNFPYV